MKHFFKNRAISREKVTRWGIGGVVCVLAFGMIGVVPDFIQAVRHPVPDALRLKADREDVLAGKTITVTNEDGIEQLATLYTYRSDEKVDTTPSLSVLEHAHKEGFAVRDEILPKRTSNSRTFNTSIPGTYISEIVSGRPQYHEDDTGVWSQIAYATTSVDAFERQLGRKRAYVAYAASADFFPDEDPETTTVDGVIIARGFSWDEARIGAAGFIIYDDLAFNGHGPAIHGSSTPNLHFIDRFITGFDTSSLGSDTIVSAEYTVNAVIVLDHYGGEEAYINVVQPAPASNTALTGTDFNNFTGLPGLLAKGSDDDKDLTFIPTGPNTWVLNATGRTWINGSGITWLGLAEGHDIENVAVILLDCCVNRISVTMAESAGTEDDPKLTVVHSPPVTTVAIDIHPGSFPNSINLDSGGVTPVAVLGSASLDVNDIDVNTLTLGTAGIKTVGKTDRLLCSVQDVSGDFSLGLGGAPDGFLDLVCKFVTVNIVPEAGDTEAKVSGDFLSGGALDGTDSVNIVP